MSLFPKILFLSLLLYFFATPCVSQEQSGTRSHITELLRQLPAPDSEEGRLQRSDFIFKHFDANNLPDLLAICEDLDQKQVRSNALVVAGFIIAVNKEATHLEKLLASIEKGAAQGGFYEKLDVLAPGYVAVAKFGTPAAFKYLLDRVDPAYWIKHSLKTPADNGLSSQDMALSMSDLVVHSLNFFTDPEQRAQVLALKSDPRFSSSVLQSRINDSDQIYKQQIETFPELKDLAKKYGDRVSSESDQNRLPPSPSTP